MISLFQHDINEGSRPLYFKLNNSFQLASPPASKTYKVAGIYALFKKNTCYYVGQSQNLPSRIATHLSGPYREIDCVHVYFVDGCGLSDFYQMEKDYRKAVLESNEKYAIQNLNPIENIMVSDGPIDEEIIFESLIGEDFDFSLKINIGKYGLYTVFTDPLDIIWIGDEILSLYRKYYESRKVSL